MTDPFERITESKRRERKRLAALPFAEKLKLLEQLRDREAAIIACRRNAPNSVLPGRVLLVREQRVAGYGTEDKQEDRDAGR